MDKLVCKCGNVIIVQVDECFEKDSIIKERDVEEFFDIICGDIGTLLNRNPGGIDREDWIIDTLGEDYPVDSSMYDVIRDYISNIWRMYFKRIYECESCGSLWLQEDENCTKFRCYRPE